MFLVCDREEFAHAFGSAAAVVPNRTPNRILENVLLRHEGARLSIEATDLEVGFVTAIERFETEGADWRLLLPANKMLAIVRELDAPRIKIEEEAGVAVVSTADSRFSIVVGEPENFPAVDVEVPENGLELDATILANMLRKVLVAVADDNTRPVLNGVLFEANPERLRLVGTDGKRLALCDHRFESPSSFEMARVVPTKAAQLLMKLCEGDGAQILVDANETNMTCRRDSSALRAQLVQGKFPQYEQVIPVGLEHEVEFGREILLGALRRASLLTNKDSFSVALRFGHNRLTLVSRTPDVGESRVELPLNYDDDPAELFFNPRYLIDALRVMDGDRVRFSFSSATQPALLQEADGAYRYVVMPLEFE